MRSPNLIDVDVCLKFGETLGKNTKISSEWMTSSNFDHGNENIFVLCYFNPQPETICIGPQIH